MLATYETVDKILARAQRFGSAATPRLRDEALIAEAWRPLVSGWLERFDQVVEGCETEASAMDPVFLIDALTTRLVIAALEFEVEFLRSMGARTAPAARRSARKVKRTKKRAKRRTKKRTKTRVRR